MTGPADPTPWDLLALAQLGRGDTAAYKETCARMLAMFDRPPATVWTRGAFAAGPFNPWGAGRASRRRRGRGVSPCAVALTAVRCSSRPDTPADWQRLVTLTAKSPDDVRGVVLCRAGRYDEAVALLEPQRGLWNPTSLEAQLVTLYLALAERGRGHIAEARQLLKEATDASAQTPADVPYQGAADQFAWTVGVQVEQMRVELDGLLKEKTP